MGHPQQEQKKILVVDDEPDLTMLCSLALEYYGFKVDTNISWLGEYIHSHIWQGWNIQLHMCDSSVYDWKYSSTIRLPTDSKCLYDILGT